MSKVKLKLEVNQAFDREGKPGKYKIRWLASTEVPSMDAYWASEQEVWAESELGWAEALKLLQDEVTDRVRKANERL